MKLEIARCENCLTLELAVNAGDVDGGPVWICEPFRKITDLPLALLSYAHCWGLDTLSEADIANLADSPDKLCQIALCLGGSRFDRSGRPRHDDLSPTSDKLPQSDFFQKLVEKKVGLVMGVVESLMLWDG